MSYRNQMLRYMTLLGRRINAVHQRYPQSVVLNVLDRLYEDAFLRWVSVFMGKGK